MISRICICVAFLLVQYSHSSSKYLMYRYSSYDDPDPMGKILISNQFGLDINFQKGSIQYGYGLFCGYVLPNQINPLANIGVGYLFSADLHEYFVGAKIETPLFYKLYFERKGNPYLQQKRSWVGIGLKSNFGMNVFKRIKLEGQMSYPFHIYSVGIGYKY